MGGCERVRINGGTINCIIDTIQLLGCIEYDNDDNDDETIYDEYDDDAV